jgi:hypothetical protein
MNDIYITHRHMVGGQTLQHIERVKWTQPGTGKTGDSARAEIVKWIDDGNKARVRDRDGSEVLVHVVRVNPPYLRTNPNNESTDNLLSLPQY